ncbi:MAG: hypothetical protein U0802_07930 [Candidatus Binatia bacterium]
MKGDPQPSQLSALAAGVTLEDGTTNPAEVHVMRQRDQKAWLAITLAEGKNRQVRRMCEAVGLPVEKLVRVAFGGLKLRNLAPGAWRHLEPAEVELLRPSAPHAARPPRGRRRQGWPAAPASRGRAGAAPALAAPGAAPATMDGERQQQSSPPARGRDQRSGPPPRGGDAPRSGRPGRPRAEGLRSGPRRGSKAQLRGRGGDHLRDPAAPVDFATARR